MKRIFLAILLLIFCTTSAFGAADASATAKTQALLTYLTNLSTLTSNKILSGQYDSEDGVSEATGAYTATGRWPAILGRDYHQQKWGDITQNAEFIAWDANKGIVTITMWFDNPDGTDLWSGAQSVNLTQMTTPGGTYNGWLNTQLDAEATKLAVLAAANVPVILRMFPEMNSGWPWYGNKGGTEFTKLWIYAFNRLTVTNGLHNLLFFFTDEFYNTNPSAYYPGSAYVDIVGVDVYTLGTDMSSLVSLYNSYLAFNKPFALGEYGYQDWASSLPLDIPTGTNPSNPRRDLNPLISSIQTYMPKTVFWMNWDGSPNKVFSLKYNNVNLATLFNNSLVVTRDEVAYYETSSHQLSVTMAGNGTGTVTSAPAGISCSTGTCLYSFSPQTVTLQRTATGGSSFAGWSGGGCSGTGEYCTINLAAATSVTATFTTAATSHYCSSSVKGSNDGTSWANAWSCAAISWSSVYPGDTVYIDGGTTSLTYTANKNSYFGLSKSGTSGSRVTVKIGQDAGHNGVAIFDGGSLYSKIIDMFGQNYLTLDGTYGGARNIKIQNSAGDNYSGAIQAGGGTAVGQIIKGVEISGAKSAITAEAYTFNTDPGVTIIEIDNVYAHNISGDTVIKVFLPDALQRAWTRYDAVLIHDSILQGNTVIPPAASFGADIIQGCSGMSIYNNEIYGVETANPGVNHQDGFQCGNCIYLKVYNNYFHDLSNACLSWDRTASVPNDGYLRVYNNIFAWTYEVTGNPQCMSVYFTGTVRDVIVANNIFVDIPSLTVSNGMNVSVFQNNTMVGCNYRGGASSSLGTLAYATDGHTIDHNVIYPGAGGNRFDCPAIGTDCAGGYAVTAVPTFVTYVPYSASNDFKLQAADTVAKDQGTSLATYFTKDKDGNIRTGTWDIGPYEYGGTPGDVTAPAIVADDLTATALSYPAVNLFWSAFSDAVGVTGYRIYRCTGVSCTPTTQVGVSSGTSYQDTNLTASTIYGYTVKAVDAVPNLSAALTTKYATTSASPDTNIALNKTVTSSSEETGAFLDNYAVDGSLSTRWSSAYTDAEWHKVDLGDAYDINKVILRWETAYGKDYTIQYSLDDATYTTAVTVTGGDGGVDTHTISPAVSGRYIKVVGTARGTAWGYSLWEFEVYGTPTAAPQPSNYLEFEDGAVCTLASTMTAKANALASGGYYVSADTTPTSGTATCAFTVAATGTYKINVRAYAADAATDSFTVAIDGEACVGDVCIYDMNPAGDPVKYGVWYDDELAHRGTGTWQNPQYDPYVVTLTAGAHTITFTGREISARLDYFTIVPVQVTEQYTLTYTKAGTGTGTIVMSPGVNCSASCAYNYNAGTPVTITGTAGGDSTFVGWSGGLCTGTDPCTVTMTEARAVTGTFNVTTPLRTLTITPGGTGLGTITSLPTGISCGSTCAFEFTDDAVVVLTATPNAGSTFTGWTGTGGCTGTAPHVIVMDADKSCTAAFARTTTPTVGTNFTLTFGKSTPGGAKITLVK